MKDKIKKYLGSGLSPSVVADIVGCDPSYVSQLLSDPEFAASVAGLKAQRFESIEQRDSKYDKLEDAFLQKLEDLSPMFNRPRDILDALSRLNAAKRRTEDLISPTQKGIAAGKIIILALPVNAVASFQLNQNNEVVAIGDRMLTGMPLSILMKEVQGERIKEDGKDDEKAAHLPTRIAERILDEESV